MITLHLEKKIHSLVAKSATYSIKELLDDCLLFVGRKLIEGVNFYVIELYRNEPPS